MRRFFIDKSEISNNTAVITGNDAKHISRVLRITPGTLIELIDGTGKTYHAEITETSPKQIHTIIRKTMDGGNESPVNITVAQAFLKDKKMDLLIRHLTELGIDEWFAFQAQRSVPSPAPGKTKARKERWEKITQEALKQCERSKLPLIGEVASFDEMIDQASKSDLKIMFHERETFKFQGENTRALPDNANIFVAFGPEGGFTEIESERLINEGFLSISMGPRILRAETATISGVTLLQYLFGDMSSDDPKV